MRIMVVDDVQMNLYLLEKAACSCGEVIAHKNPLLALEECRTSAISHQAIDLVFLDISMPSMDGLEFLRRLRRMEDELGLAERTRVVIVTAHAERDLVAKAIHQGAQGFLLKPIVAEKIHAEFRRLFPESTGNAASAPDAAA